MMPNPLNLLLCLLLHLSYEIRTCRVVTTCEEEVLPHENSLPVTDLVEIIGLYDTPAPDTDLLFRSAKGFLDERG